MKKRMVCLLLVLVMVLGLCPVSMAAAPSAGLDNFKKVNTYTPGQFSDVSDKAWYAANVKASIELGLVTGRDSGFAPDANMQIVEAIALAAKIHSIYHTGSAKFVQGSPWYQVYVDYAVDNGIIAAGEYANLSVPATRGQFFNIFAKSVPESALQPINDVAVGSIHDLPAASEYAEAAYLLYNAGILTGSDAYGTFNAEKQITRIEAATLATRVADPTLRKTVELKVYDPYPPTGLTVKVVGRMEPIDAGKQVMFFAELTPANARSGMTWTSSDPEVLFLDEYGQGRGLKEGTVTVTATAYNGVSGTMEITVRGSGGTLQYALTDDGKGYEIIGCDANAYLAHIPATYQGLPVVSVKPGAFKDCKELNLFTVDPEQKTFYAQDGVLFTDSPVKTLVAFPPSYDRSDRYCVPADTLAIGPYGFAGISINIGVITLVLPEGVRKLGDYAFAEAGYQYFVYVPASLTEIGDYILQNQDANVPFYGPDEKCAFALYARKHTIPYATRQIDPPGEQTAKTGLPVWRVPTAADRVDSGDVLYAVPPRSKWAGLYDTSANLYCHYDFSQLQSTHRGEIRLDLDAMWADISPDVNGDTRVNFPEKTGLYGAGYTEGSAVLRGYDRTGNLICVQEVTGNFAFAFPGACQIGVEGGTGTGMTVLPVEPVYVTSPGAYPVDPDQWGMQTDGNVFRYFITCFAHATYYMDLPLSVNMGYGHIETATGEQPAVADHFMLYTPFSTDTGGLDNLSGITLNFGGMEVLLDNEEFNCTVDTSFNTGETFAQDTYAILKAVKEVMVGNYFPESVPIRKITLLGDGAYPACNMLTGTISLDQSLVERFGVSTIAHEMIHAVDSSLGGEKALLLLPDAWLEGRTTYLERIVEDRLNGEENTYVDEFDWSFLSPEEKADFCDYFCNHTNRINMYDVGYHFLVYLNGKYGEDVSGRIMANVAALTDYEVISNGLGMGLTQRNTELFKQCVEAATEVGVFQNFVRDVIEQ